MDNASRRRQAADIAADIIGLRRADKQSQYFILTPKKYKKPAGFETFADAVADTYFMGSGRGYVPGNERGGDWRQRISEIEKTTGIRKLDDEFYNAIQTIKDIARVSKDVNGEMLQKAYRAIAAMEEYANHRINADSEKIARVLEPLQSTKRIMAQATAERQIRDGMAQDMTQEQQQHMHFADGLWNIRQGLERIMHILGISPLERGGSRTV